MAEEFDITAEHPAYAEYAPDWRLMRDAAEGEREVKEKGEAYLPMPSGMKAMSGRNDQKNAYAAYQGRAEFPEIVAPTIRGSVGLIHSKASTIELPAALEPLRIKATRDGLTLDNLHQKVTAEILRVGRTGLMPGIVPDGQPEAGTFYLAPYSAETAINWDAPKGPLEYLVLNESGCERDPDTNKWEMKGRYLECALIDSAFQFRKWIEQGKRPDGKPKFVPDGDWTPASVQKAKALPFLPFTFINTMDLTAEPDDVPMFGLAKLAFRAYQLDADYRLALHMTSAPTPWITGCSADDAPKTIGSGSLWVLTSELAKVGFLEFTGPGIEAQEKAIANSLERAIMFGAQLFAENKRTAESGDAIRLRLGNQTSTLKMVAVASAAGLEKALKDTAVWAGVDPEQVKVEPNLEFVDRELSPQEIVALVGAWQAGAMRKLDLHANLQRGGVVDPEVPFEDWQEEIEAEGPALGMVPAQTGDPAQDQPGGE